MPSAEHPLSPVLILGMHRSGTSCLAGALQRAGLHLGAVSERNKHNPKGNRERDDVRLLHDAVLEANGYGWNAPPPPGAPPPAWSAGHLDEQQRILRALAEPAAPFGLKDPRMMLVLEAWIRAAPGAMCVGTIRHPAAVIASLRKRQPKQLHVLTEVRCADLWIAYNTRLLAHAQSTALPMVSFDWEAGRYLAAVRAMAEELGLPRPAALDSFFDASMRHAHEGDIALPEAALDLWSDLMARCITP